MNTSYANIEYFFFVAFNNICGYFTDIIYTFSTHERDESMLTVSHTSNKIYISIVNSRVFPRA